MDEEAKQHMAMMCARIHALETKVDQLLTVFERTTGAWMLIKWGGSAIIGISTLWAILFDHIKIK